MQKIKEVLLQQSNYTITFLPAGRNQPNIISKRDVGSIVNKLCCSPEAARIQMRQTMEILTTSGMPTTSDGDKLSDRQIEAEPPEPEIQQQTSTEQKRKKLLALQKLNEKVMKSKAVRMMEKENKPIINIDSETEEEEPMPNQRNMNVERKGKKTWSHNRTNRK